LIAQFILSATRFGRNLFMVGSSFRAAEAVGVSTWRTVTGAYVWAGFFTSLSGIMLAIRYDSANMDYGVAYDYDAIAAVLPSHAHSVGQPAFGRQSVAHCPTRLVETTMPSSKCIQGRCCHPPMQFGPRFAIE
jgi:hypothetical protein